MFRKGLYEHGQGYVYSNRHCDMGAYANLFLFPFCFIIIIFLENKSGYEYGIEHARRSAPNTDIQPGIKERIHIRHKHKQGYREFISMHVRMYVHMYIHTHTRKRKHKGTAGSYKRGKRMY